MEWNNTDHKFEKRLPKPAPCLNVEVSLMTDTHRKFGVHCEEFPPVNISAIADTGCQTSTSGSDVLSKMKIPERYLIPTRHKIVGITDTPLDILGALMLKISYNERTTNQMVHVSSKPSGLYLSETALKELGVIDDEFPNQSQAGPVSTPLQGENNDCKCIPRTTAPDRPEKIPFHPSKKNVPKLKQWLIERFSASAFNKCTHQELQEMAGEPMNIVFKEGVAPHAVHTPIPVPIHWKDKIKEDLDRDVRLGIIEPVPQGTPTTWCARMVVAHKKDGTPRRTVDLQNLKNVTMRETHFTRTPFSIVSSIPVNTQKTVLDAWNGYHSLPLSASARNATTFITEWGRYRYKRAPMGHHASGDAYTRRFDDITQDFERVSRCVDDSLLWDETIEDAFWHTYDYLKHCSDNGIIFNINKFIFAAEVCEFAGFEVTKDGYRPPKHKLDAIRDFPTPQNITDIRSWFGLINQLSYAFVQTDMMTPFRELLSQKHSKFYWDDNLNTIFEESKKQIVDLIKKGVKTFEKDRVTCISTDYSKKGLGFTLTQKHCACPKPYAPDCGNGHWRLVLCGSRFTTAAESRYAPIEGEALAAAYGLHQCKNFVMGCPNLIVATDHKPLTRILNDRSLETIDNPRLLRIKEKTLMFVYDIVHVAGKANQAPDAMSRYPTESVDEELNLGIEESSRAYAISQSSALPSSVSWTKVNNEAAVDNECLILKEVIQDGFPNERSMLPEELRYFWPMRKDLYVIDNVPFKGKKMLIPAALRAQVCEWLHASHQGVSSMSANAKERLFWPRLDSDLKQTRNQCNRCQGIAPSQPAEAPVPSPEPAFPFERVAADQCKIGSKLYIIYADRFSGWTEVAMLGNQSLKSIKKSFLRWFTTFGVPEEIATDGGPPYNSLEYGEFLKTWDISKRLSSAYYPRAMAELRLQSS